MEEKAIDIALKFRYFIYHFRCILHHLKNIAGEILHCRKSRFHISSLFFRLLWHTTMGLTSPKLNSQQRLSNTRELRWALHGREWKTESEFSTGRLSWIHPSPQMFCDTLRKIPWFPHPRSHNKMGRWGTASTGTDSEVSRWECGEPGRDKHI